MFNRYIETLASTNTETRVFMIVSIIILTMATVLVLRYTKRMAVAIMLLFLTHITFGFFLRQISSYSPFIHIPIYVFPSFFLGYVLDAILPSKEKEKKDPFQVKLSANVPVNFSMRRHVGIFGASGSGKSESGFIPLFKHCTDMDMPILSYDYKNFELTECLNFFHSSSNHKMYTVCPDDPDMSHKVNPVLPKYIEKMDDVNSRMNVLVENLSPNQNREDAFFNEAAAGALAGTVWKLKESYTPKCNLAYASALLLRKSIEDTANFIKSNTYASICAATFLDSLESDRQMAAIKATISSITRKLCTPELFAILSGNDFDLNLNDPKNPASLSVVNNPKRESVQSPICALIMHSALMQMAERNRLSSTVFIDEGGTLKLPNLQKSLETLRSFNIAFVWGLQDKIQGDILYNEKVLKAILANLSTKIIGKANDPDTAQYYQRFFELISEVQRSYSRGGSGDTRVNISERERVKHRAYEFMQLREGEFFVFDDKGKNNKLKFNLIPFEKVRPKPVYNHSQTELKKNFEYILRDAASLV